MAKLNSYYTLCPLIDQQNLLGVEKDVDSGCAIVTLGRNIVIRYKLHDLKQLSSWSTKERLTTQVIYDKQTDRYAAIFNEKYLRVWSQNDTDLDEVKRYKFKNPIQTIVSLDNTTPVLVRQDGATTSLEWALKNRKTWASNGILIPNEKLSDCKLININNKTYFCALTVIDDTYNYIVVGLQEQTYHENPDEINRIQFKKTSKKLIGHVILQDQNNAYLLTLWSHGKLYSYPLTGTCPDPVPGILVSVFFPSISTNHPVVMVPLNNATIAVYGADVNEEGAVLLIYNIQFKLVQAIQKLKLYTREAKLWRIDDKILLAANRHLAIAPYRLASQKIEAMIGSSLRLKTDSKISDEDNDVLEVRESVIANWHDASAPPNKISTKTIPQTISKQVHVFLNEGTSDAVINQTLIPQLIESKDISSILWCLNTFKDLPENLLIDLLAFGLRTSDSVFIPIQNGTNKRDDDHNTNHITRNRFLDKIFSCCFANITLVSHLKSKLVFNEVLRLINYFIEKLSSEEYTVDQDDPCDKHLYEWTSLLIDSHYQHYLLSQDSEVFSVLSKLSSTLDDHFRILNDLKNLRPMVQRIMRGKSIKPNRTEYNKFYSIEEVRLY